MSICAWMIEGLTGREVWECEEGDMCCDCHVFMSCSVRHTHTEYKTIKGGIYWLHAEGSAFNSVWQRHVAGEKQGVWGYAVTIKMLKKFLAKPYQTSHLLFVAVCYLLTDLIYALKGKLVWQFIDPENVHLLELNSYSERQYVIILSCVGVFGAVFCFSSIASSQLVWFEFNFLTV